MSLDDLTPESNMEKYFAKIAGETVELPPPSSKLEKYLAKMAGEDVELPPPSSNLEKFAAAAAESGGGVEVEEITITQNGTTTAPEGKAYSPIITNVPNTYEAGDEGKVVSNGALVAQTATSVTQNGTIDTTLNNSVEVNVQGGGTSGNGVLFLTQNNDGYPLTAQVIGLTAVPPRMFNNDDTTNGFYLNLTSVDLPSGITSIGERAFRNCPNLVSVNLPSSLTAIENRAFTNCANLVLTSLPSGVVYAKEYAFYGCTSLTEMKFEGNLLLVSDYAFANCSNILKYDFTNNIHIPMLAATNAFQSINANCKIVVPDSLYAEWVARSSWSTYASYIVKESDYAA